MVITTISRQIYRGLAKREIQEARSLMRLSFGRLDFTREVRRWGTRF
jgi:hypothetical protein